jgi:acyl-CoA synthetase (AMP-forming)/AMP-acid ligase II
MTFLVDPAIWLRAISKFRATTSGGPNFAYELCVHRVVPEEIEGVDLSSWRIAFNGAEPVKAHVIDAFIEKFAPYGFRAETFYPCYGLAESTLFVTGGAPTDPTVALAVDPEELRQNRAVEQPGSSTVLVGCGRPNMGQSVVIVDPESLSVLPEGHVGEIWQSGGSVTAGYWAKPDVTAATFGARTANGDGPFMRTGDLGFLKNGELFVSGRLKDLIIIRGRNYYPDDLESAVYQSSPSLRPGGAAAFTLSADGGETELIVVAEVQKWYLPLLDTNTHATLVADARARIADLFGLRLVECPRRRAGSCVAATAASSIWPTSLTAPRSRSRFRHPDPANEWRDEKERRRSRTPQPGREHSRRARSEPRSFSLAERAGCRFRRLLHGLGVRAAEVRDRRSTRDAVRVLVSTGHGCSRV